MISSIKCESFCNRRPFNFSEIQHVITAILDEITLPERIQPPQSTVVGTNLYRLILITVEDVYRQTDMILVMKTFIPILKILVVILRGIVSDPNLLQVSTKIGALKLFEADRTPNGTARITSQILKILMLIQK